ncbi:MAG: FkbM family methyltransferase, partial [Lachnospiraceae bacterium]|nr:FkbM family methyltransferase [Lachnospiraceae bacterium]
YSRDTLHLHEMVYEDFVIHLAGYRRTYSLLQDDWSKKILLERIRCYLLSSPITSSGAEKQYFDPDIITLIPDEILVDGGMYTGDTAQSFFQFSNDQYRQYYGFEPDERNFLAAENNLKGKGNLTLVRKGLWSHAARLVFSGSLASSSRLNEGETGDFVEVTALDAFFQNREAPTFIKMDIEGAEREALAGAEQLIRSHKPKLAICAYHKVEDIYTLPELIRTFRDDYTFYLRHYSDTIYETVLYAV